MWLIKDVFSVAVLEQVSVQYLQYTSRKDLWFGITDRWEPELLEGFDGEQIKVCDLGHSFSQYLVRHSVHRHIPQLRISDSSIVRYRAQFCLMGPGAGINFHRDSHYLWSATVYLNSSWDRLQGGWFCADDFMHVPCYNSMVVNTDSSRHMVSEVYGSEPRKTLQIWAIP